MYMASHALTGSNILSFYVGFSSYRQFRKAHATDSSKVKSWGRGILDLDFESRNCVIRNGEKTLLIQPFTEFQKIVTSEGEGDHYMTLIFDSDEWDIIPQNIAERACILHFAQFLAQSNTAVEVVKNGLEKGLIGLEHENVIKQGLVQQYDDSGRKLQLRFLILVPGKLFGFQKQHEESGYRPANFVTSLLSARVTTIPEVTGFQLHVDQLDILYLDPVEEVERLSWINELNASIESVKNTKDGLLLMMRPTATMRPSRVEWRDANPDVRSINYETDSTDAPLDASQTEGSQEGKLDARSKPLSRARICLEDSLAELRILIAHIQAASSVLHDLHLFTADYQRERKKYPSPVTSRWPSTGRERLSPRQRYYAYEDGLEQDLPMSRWDYQPLSPQSYEIYYGTSNWPRDVYEPSSNGGQRDMGIVPPQQPAMDIRKPRVDQGFSQQDLKTFDQDQPTPQGAQESRESLRSDGMQNGYGYVADPNMQQTLQATGDNGFQQQPSSTIPTTNAMPESRKGIKPSLSRQPSARASRAVAFSPQPDIREISSDDIAPLEEWVLEPQAAPMPTVSRQSVKPSMTSEPRVSQANASIANNYLEANMTDQSPEVPMAFTGRKSLGAVHNTMQQMSPGNASWRQSSIGPNGGGFALAGQELPPSQNNNQFQSTVSTMGGQDLRAFNAPDQQLEAAGMLVSGPNGSEGQPQEHWALSEDTSRASLTQARKSTAPPLSQAEARKSFASRKSQSSLSQTEARKSFAVNRQSQDDVFEHEGRKTLPINSQTQAPVPEIRKSVAPTTQFDARKSFANRQSSVQPLSAMPFEGPPAATFSSIPPSSYTGELRKSVYQGGSSNLQQQDVTQPLPEILNLQQEVDSSATSTLTSSSSTPDMLDPVSRVEFTGQDTMAGNPMSRVSSIARPVELAANEQRSSSLAARPSSFNAASRQSSVRVSTRGDSHMFGNISDENPSDGRRRSQ